MQRLQEIVESRQRVAHEYISLLLDEPHLILPTIDEQTVMSWFVFVVRLTGEAGVSGSRRDSWLPAQSPHRLLELFSADSPAAVLHEGPRAIPSAGIFR